MNELRLVHVAQHLFDLRRAAPGDAPRVGRPIVHQSARHLAPVRPDAGDERAALEVAADRAHTDR